MTIIIAGAKQSKHKRDSVVEFFTAEAPSPESVLVAIHALGFNVTHLGGLIEAYRLAVINDWNLQWENRTAEDKLTLKAP